MFEKLLVANRGEIAVRILRTVREMGIRSVAVYSDADRGAPHLALADEAVPLGDPEPASSYLSVPKILEAARRTGAEAIHPGYGFLSESPDFARAVRDAGLIFVGPPPEAMALLGNKLAARRLARECGIPAVPGTAEAEADPGRLADLADGIGYPVLVKAAAGGGGKGMRLVRRREEMAEAAQRAASEARAAFGDGSVYLEKWLPAPRHVEIQILADSLGRVLHLNERECSIQRRHQKLLEESPSPALDPGLRREMGEAAVALALRAGYVNAGTVEFLLGPDRRFLFLEVNARLQVEHPVTEMTTGLDLVRCQIEIAAGLPLALRPEDLLPRGHAIECRLYAEDPGSGFLPAPGRIERLREPCGPGIRFDGGVAAGSEVPAHYDPLLGKVVAHGPTRGAAIARMIRALEDCVIEGVPTPRDLLLHLLRSEPFRAGRTHTGLLEEVLQGWRPPERPERARSAPPVPARPASPWHDLGAFDLVSGGEPARREPRPAVPAPARRRAAAGRSARERVPETGPGAVTPPMPASVVAVLVEVGQVVEQGQPAVVVSAMKMEIQLGAPCSGRVRAVSAAAGQNVRPGDVLVEIEIEQPGGLHAG